MHYCNLILVNHFVRAHRVGPCGATASAPVTSWFWSPNSRPALVRARGPTKTCGLPNGGSDARTQCTLQKMELVSAMMEGDGEYSADQNMRNTWWAFAGTKKKKSMVRDVVDGDDIPDLQLQIISWRTQMTRYVPARQKWRCWGRAEMSCERAARPFHANRQCCGWWKAVQGTPVGHWAVRQNSDGRLHHE